MIAIWRVGAVSQKSGVTVVERCRNAVSVLIADHNVMRAWTRVDPTSGMSQAKKKLRAFTARSLSDSSTHPQDQ